MLGVPINFEDVKIRKLPDMYRIVFGRRDVIDHNGIVIEQYGVDRVARGQNLRDFSTTALRASG